MLKKELKPVHIFDFNGTLIAKELGSVCENHARENVFRPLFQTILDLKESDWVERFPEASKHGLSQQEIYERVLAIVSNPPKFTKAREIYYNIIEEEIRKGKINIGLEQDVLEEKSVLRQLSERKIATMLLSRGTKTLIDALLDGVNLRGYFSFFDSTISYGNNKIKSTYLNLIRELSGKGFRPVAFYEDETEPLYEIYQAGMELKDDKKEFPFKLYWINRENADTGELTDTVPETEREDFMNHVETHPNLLFNAIVS